MTDNLIIIKGGTHNDIKKALRQWIERYSTDLQDGLTFQLFKHGHGKHIIQADTRLDNERFFYLVNHLNYPEGIEYPVEAEGFTTGKDKNQLKDKKLLVYISGTDKEYDNVFVTTAENENFKIDFGGKITETKENRIFNYPADLLLEHPETIRIHRKAIDQKAEKANKDGIDKRFKVLSFIVASLTLIGIITHQFGHPSSSKFSFFLGLGIAAWFFADDQMLRSDRHYFYSLGISLGYLILVLLYNGTFNKTILDYGALYPITFLLVQKPARLIYKAILNREPVIERPPPTFWDGIYMLILFLSIGVLPFVIMDILTK